MAGRKKAGGNSPDMAAVVVVDEMAAELGKHCTTAEQVKQDKTAEQVKQDKTAEQGGQDTAKEIPRKSPEQMRAAAAKEFRRLQLLYHKPADNITGGADADSRGGTKKRRGLKNMQLAIDENKYNALLGLMKQTAFMSAQLDDLAEQLYYVGVTETYKNGAEQFGTKESTQSKAYNSMIKNYTTAIKTLADCTPEAEVKDALMEFMAARARARK